MNAAEAHLRRSAVESLPPTYTEACDILRLLVAHKPNAYVPAAVPAGCLRICPDGQYRVTTDSQYRVTTDSMLEAASQQARRQTAVHVLIEAQTAMAALLRSIASQEDCKHLEAGLRQAEASLFAAFRLLAAACPPGEIAFNVNQA